MLEYLLVQTSHVQFYKLITTLIRMMSLFIPFLVLDLKVHWSVWINCLYWYKPLAKILFPPKLTTFHDINLFLQYINTAQHTKNSILYNAIFKIPDEPTFWGHCSCSLCKNCSVPFFSGEKEWITSIKCTKSK